MRIASVAFTNYDADPRVRRMSEALIERGDSVTAVTLRQPGQERRREVAGVRVYTINITQYQGSSFAPYILQYVRFLFAAMWLLTRLHLRDRFDVIHVNNMPDFIVFAALPAKLLGAKVILDLHDPMPELFVAKFEAGSKHPAVRIVTLVERISIGFADRAICVQQVHLETFVSHGNPLEKFVEVQNAADTRNFPVGAALEHVSTSGKTRVIYHGTVAPRLGIDTLVEAIALERDAFANVEVVLIGDGDAGADIQDLIAERSLGDIIDFRRGFIPVTDLLPELQQADIGVVPAGMDAFTSTMLPSKLLEYVTLGIPTACSDLPAVRRYFAEDEIRYFPAGDARALAGVLVDLLGNPAERELQARRAMRFLDVHGWEMERDKYLSLIDELGGNTAPGR